MSIPIGEKEQLALFLKYENAVGSLIYFDEEGLRDIIIIEPSWIIQAFRCLISAKCFEDKYGPLREDWQAFIEKGQLKTELAAKIWKLDKEKGFFENTDILLLFLDKLDIMSKAKVIKEVGQIEEQDFYFVPCLLKEPPTEGLLATRKEKDILSSSTLCFTFKDDFLPPAIFNRIMSICLGMWPPVRQKKRQLLFCGCGMFQVTPDTYSDRYGLTIFFKDSKIGLRVTRYATVPDASVDSRLCDKIRRLITLALEKELTRYQRSIDESPDKTEKSYEYAVMCPETQVSKQLTDGLLNVDALMQYYNQKRRYFCWEHDDKDHPHLLEPADLLRHWFPDLIVPNEKGFLNCYPSERLQCIVTDYELAALSRAVGSGWQILGLDLGLTQVEVDHCEEGRPNKPLLQIHEMLKTWKNSKKNEATIGNLARTMDTCNAITVDREIIKNILDRII